MFKRMLVLAICLAATAMASNNKYSETKSRTWDFPANGILAIHVFGADVEVVEGEPAQLSASALVQSDSADYAQRVTMTFDRQGSNGTLNVKQPSHGGNLSIKIKVPPGTDV